jgi:hypothetical protein
MHLPTATEARNLSERRTGGSAMYYQDSDEKRYACYNCNEELLFDVKIGRRDMCPNCSAYLHSCYNCEYHDPNAHNQCRENQGEFIRDRAEGNFCLHFQFRTIHDDGTTEAEKAKDQLNALFGEGPSKGKGPAPAIGSPSTEDEARSRLEDLFKK